LKDLESYRQLRYELHINPERIHVILNLQKTDEIARQNPVAQKSLKIARIIFIFFYGSISERKTIRRQLIL